MILIHRFLIFIFVICSFLIAGTDGTIRGKVTDVDGAPLPGANIYVPDVGIYASGW